MADSQPPPGAPVPSADIKFSSISTIMADSPVTYDPARDKNLPNPPPATRPHHSPPPSSRSSTTGPPLAAPRRSKRPSSASNTSLPEGQSSSTAAGSSSKRRSSRSNTTTSQAGPSHRESTTTNMPGILVEDEVTYTPTTHRISKAKKGKRVHVCEHDGCGKVFSRAEHRKRHEANHSTEPKFRCEIANCGKPFQRADLLHRHLERQHDRRPSNTPSTGQRPRQRRPSSQASSRQAQSPANSPAPSPAPSRAPAAAPAPAITSPSVAMSIESIIAPRNNQYAMGHTEEPWHADVPMHLPHVAAPRSGMMRNCCPSDESAVASSDTCYSPMSDVPTAQVYHQPYLPPYPNAPARSTSFPIDMSSNMPSDYSMPYPEANIPAWEGYGSAHPADGGLGIGLEGPTATTAALERNGHGRVPRDRGSAPARMDANQGGMVRLNDRTISHYYGCYWEHFHPLCPIVHFATFMSVPHPPPQLATMMLAIGAQFSPEFLAGSHSMSFFQVSLQSPSPVDQPSSRAPLVVLQTIVLREAFALYRSRDPGVYKSSTFSALYSSFLNNRKQLDMNPISVLDSLPENPDLERLHTVHFQWADLEARRRLLLAAFVHETQRNICFPQKEQCPIVYKQTRNLPNPCPQVLWDEADSQEWFKRISKLRNPLFSQQPSNNDPFQAAINQCIANQHQTLVSSIKSTSNSPISDVLLMATHTPIQSLLTVAADSWLYANKVTEVTDWTTAKADLRKWADGDVAAKAVWHAVQLLRAAFPKDKDSKSKNTCLGLAERWCLYLAALVCWAYGFKPNGKAERPTSTRTSSATSTSDRGIGHVESGSDEMGMREYLNIVQGLGDMKGVGNMAGKGGTKGILAGVQKRLRGREGGWGRLGVEADDVLGRLIEGRGGWAF